MELTKCQKHLNEVQAMTLNQLIKYKITGRLESEVRFMSKNTKQTSKSVASKASKILSDGRYSKKAVNGKYFPAKNGIYFPAFLGK